MGLGGREGREKTTLVIGCKSWQRRRLWLWQRKARLATNFHGFHGCCCCC